MEIGKRTLQLLLSAALLAFAASPSAQFLKSLDVLDKIKPGVTTSEEVRQLLGPPANTMRFPKQGYDAMQYDTYDRVVISVEIGTDGKVREVKRIRAPSF